MTTTLLFLIWGLLPALTLPLLIALLPSGVGGTKAFIGANVLTIAAALVCTAGAYFSTQVLSMLSSAAWFLALALLYIGVRQFFGLRIPLWHAVTPILAAAMLYVSDGMLARMVIGSSVNTVVLGMVGVTLVRMRRQAGPSLSWRYAACAAFVVSAAHAARAMAYITGLVPVSTLLEPDAAGLVFILLDCLMVPALFLGLVLLVQGRITQHLQTALTFDSLTGAYTRRSIMRALTQAVANSRHSGRPFALLLLDLDYFKSINDLHGHPVGDAVLQHFSATIRNHVRGSDRLGRLGGEEFVLLMQDADLTEALALVGRLRCTLQDMPYRAPDGQEIKVTSSGGLTAYGSGDTAETLIARADAALYHAKDQGRNTVTVIAAGQQPGPAFGALQAV